MFLSSDFFCVIDNAERESFSALTSAVQSYRYSLELNDNIEAFDGDTRSGLRGDMVDLNICTVSSGSQHAARRCGHTAANIQTKGG